MFFTDENRIESVADMVGSSTDRKRALEVHILYAATYNTGGVVKLQLDHGSFSDEVFAKWPLRAWNAANSYEVIERTRSLVAAFFGSEI